MSQVFGRLASTLLFTAIAPFTVLVVVPLLLLGPHLAPEGWAWLGVAPIAAGVTVLLVCFAGFVLEGRGTPAPYDPPRRLVTGVLYARVRNPMYVGLVMALLGESLLFRSGQILAWTGVASVAFHAFIVLYEEPTLRARFGATYEDYLRRVPRWIPRA